MDQQLYGNDCNAGQTVYFVGKIFQCDIVAYLNIVMNVHIWYIFKAVFAFKALFQEPVRFLYVCKQKETVGSKGVLWLEFHPAAFPWVINGLISLT